MHTGNHIVKELVVEVLSGGDHGVMEEVGARDKRDRISGIYT